MARPRIRNSNLSDFQLFSSDVALGWRVIRRVAFAYGEQRCARGEFRRVYDEFRNHIGYQPVQRQDATVNSDPSRAALGVPEMKANAGLMGRSRTKGLRPEDRVGRVHPKSGRLLPAEDFVERAQELVKLYPRSANFRTGDRAVRVYPRGATV